jgi:RNA polymerase sigma-70 factor (ECF subfamily)
MTRPEPRPDSPDTACLLGRAADGDRAAVDDLLARHRPAVRAFVDRHLDPAVRGRIDASDVVQDAHIAVAERLPDYLARRPMPFHLWVRKTAYERMLNARAGHLAKCRDVRYERLVDGAADGSPGRDPSPSAVAAAAEVADRVAAAVAALPDADREIFMLHQADGLPYAEVAVLLDITPAAARQRYARALVRLGKDLTAQGILGETG